MVMIPDLQHDPDFLRAWYNEHEMSRAIGMELVDVGAGWARTRLSPPPGLRNPNGAVNGGVLAWFADLTGGAAIVTVTGEGGVASTIELGIHYMRAAMKAPFEGHGRIVRRGRSLVFIAIDITDATGDVCVAASGVWSARHGASPPRPAPDRMNETNR